VVHQVLRQGGRPLNAGVHAYFERGLGADLGAVRVHTGEQANRSAHAVDAVAFSAGSHLVFRAGRYAPSQPEGLQLLAHELAHVAQSPQTAPAGAALLVGRSSAPEERQASMTAERLAGGERADAQRPALEPALRRQTPDDEPKETVKPLIPIPFFDQFDVKPYGPAPGSKGPTPYDAPGKTQDIPGGGPSMEDLHSGAHAVLDKHEPKVEKHVGKMPSCESLETPDSSRMNRHYRSFDQYDQDRKVFHDQYTSKDPWPILSEAEYNRFIDDCPKSEAPILKPDFGPVEKQPLQDAPGPALPPGQAYA
jgi:Domain of unknown function (DUF4157)